jgi:hypothetical protein
MKDSGAFLFAHLAAVPLEARPHLCRLDALPTNPTHQPTNPALDSIVMGARAAKPPFSAVEPPARPHKRATESSFAVGNAKGA